MKRNKNLISIVLIMTLLVVSSVMNNGIYDVKAEMSGTKETKIKEEKIYCQAMVEDSFAGDSILITLTEKESRKFKRYTEKDFSEIECESVEDLTEYTVDYVEECYDKQTFTK